MALPKCAICGDRLIPDTPTTIYGINPLTFRKAWMCLYCHYDACDEIKLQPSKSVQFDNRFDEYLEFIQNTV